MHSEIPARDNACTDNRHSDSPKDQLAQLASLVGQLKNNQLNVQETHESFYALEIVTNIKENFPKPLLEYWGEDTLKDTLVWFKKAQETAISSGASFVSIYFNTEEPAFDAINDVIARFQKLLIDVQNIATVPLIIRGSGQKDFDKKLIPKLIDVLNKPAIVAFAQDFNYKPIVSAILNSPIKDSIYLVLRAPIDINLSKEMNVLAADAGMQPDKIIMDTDTGCVGLGLDYGYSIIERICTARQSGDMVLSSPIIVFSGEETYKAKESKSSDFKDYRGELKTRSLCWEITTTNALLLAGANIAVCWSPETISVLSNLYKNCEGN